MKKILILILVLSFLLCLNFVSAELIFYEPFDGAESVSQNNGVIKGNISFVDTKCGKAANFSYYTYPNPYISYSLKDNFNGENLTIEFWVRNNDLQSAGYFDIGRLIAGHPNSMGIYYNVNNVITEIRNNITGMYQAWGSGTYLGYRWHHIAFTLEDGGSWSKMTTYIDGSPGTYTYVYNFYPNMSSDFWIGQNYYYGSADAYVDELKIYDNKKSPKEIMQDYDEMMECEAGDINKKECIITKPESTGNVKVNCSGLYVDNKEFDAKGVGYSPIPIGLTADIVGGDRVIFNTPEIYNRDFPLLREMHTNTIKTWGEVKNMSFLDAAWNNGTNPLYVIMGFWINCNEDYSNDTIRQKYIANFTTYVRSYKNHPAVLMWALGNENNLGYCSSSSYVYSFYTLANDLAEIAYKEEGSNYHPVGVINGDTGNLISASDIRMNYTDYWGINVYRGKSLAGFFDDYSSQTGKPLLIAEYGIDAWNNSAGREYEQVQADWDVSLWNQINASKITIGSAIMEYSDEWWKAPYGNISKHDNGGYSTKAHPDGYSNEEWWGVMRTIDNGDNPDIMEKRQVYYDLKCLWLEGNIILGDANHDRTVDIFDLALVGKCYGQKAIDECSIADIKVDGKIDIFDLAIVGKNYGSVC